MRSSHSLIKSYSSLLRGDWKPVISEDWRVTERDLQKIRLPTKCASSRCIIVGDWKVAVLLCRRCDNYVYRRSNDCVGEEREKSVGDIDCCLWEVLSWLSGCAGDISWASSVERDYFSELA